MWKCGSMTDCFGSAWAPAYDPIPASAAIATNSRRVGLVMLPSIPCNVCITKTFDVPDYFDINVPTMRNKLAAFTVIFATLLISTVRADDWPQWRGPQRNGISKETGLLKSWPKEGPKLLWQAKGIGSGFSTPSVVGDRLYFLS